MSWRTRCGQASLNRMPIKRPGLTIAFPLILLGLIGTTAAVFAKSSDTQFVAQEQRLSPIQPAALERLAAAAPDPRPGLGGQHGIQAVCSPHGYGEMRNPWSCVVRYPRGGSVRYSVAIDPRGNMHGVDSTGQFVIYGCCVGVRPSQ